MLISSKCVCVLNITHTKSIVLSTGYRFTTLQKTELLFLIHKYTNKTCCYDRAKGEFTANNDTLLIIKKTSASAFSICFRIIPMVVNLFF